jgi:hypothetical protein
LILSCGGNRLEEKGFALNTSEENNQNTEQIDGLITDSVKLATRPGNILLTKNPNFRLTPIYKVNLNNKKGTTFIGSNRYLSNYSELSQSSGNNWNYNFMPGFAVVSGYNMVNVSHYDLEINKSKNLFDQPVLIKNLYYPAFTNDTLNYRPVTRNYYMVSVYDEDTNQDNYINIHDLRRMYLFDEYGNLMVPLIPKEYSAFKSAYDPANDVMSVYAKLDENGNGLSDEYEAIHIFWIDLKDPRKTGRQF